MTESIDKALNRTHNCGQLGADDVGSPVSLCGWVRSYRDHGGIVFIDLRDREGITQIVFDPSDDAELHDLAGQLRNEWVISVAGKVRPRGEDRINPKLPTGQIEIIANKLTVLNKSETVPFEPDSTEKVSEDTRLKYRYVDLRRAEMTHNIRLRHSICRAMRSVLDERDFIEIETPFLTKSTPEGARDFLVPSRLRQACFYALPQSPQLFKQILMVSGLDKYYQIVRCFRDEDLRADRQPEFTQLDVEMSFVTEPDVMDVANEVLREICRVCDKPFPDEPIVLTYAEAMDKYGSDRPDMRFELFLRDASEIVANCSFKVFAGCLADGGAVRGICVPGGAKFTRKEIDGFTAFVGDYGAKGLAWCKVESGAFAGGVAKILEEPVQSALREAFGANDGDILFFVADTPATVNKALGALRCKLGEELGLFGPDDFAWCWVTHFPLVEWSEDQHRWTSLHHPFTSPRPDQIDMLESEPAKVSSRAYDIVLNGVELGGGSIRIHSTDLQGRIFSLLGISPEEAKSRFGFLLEALRFGAPPHGGIALGLDRVVMMMVGATSLRDVIAFPKTQRGFCPLTGAPAEVEDKQLAELDLKIIAPPQK